MCELIKIDAMGKTVSVAEMKKKYIENIIRQAKDCSLIDRVVLFGSAATDRCTEDSDIDLAVFGAVSEHKALTSKQYKAFVRSLYAFDFGQDYDVLYFAEEDLGAPIFGEIRKGVTLYEKQ